MGDRGRITQLEELYSGIPDESVDLTFQDLAVVKHKAISPENRKTVAMDSIPEVINVEKATIQGSPMRKMPSLDFNRGLQATNNQQNHYEDVGRSSFQFGDGGSSPFGQSGFRKAVENSKAYGDVSMVSMSQDQRGSGSRRRPGIPHTNICTICSTSVLMFKHRCLVCGRVYCKECVGIGMGEMTEGRKCIDCLGRRFSQRYIQRAGETGCFLWGFPPNKVRQAELKWAERGPRRNRETDYERSGMMSFAPGSPMIPSRPNASNNPDCFVPKSPNIPSRAHIPRSPMAPSRAYPPRSPMTPIRAHGPRSPVTPSRDNGGSNQNSSVMSGSYSPYSPAHHHLPF